jgi:hypothetical protein
LEARPTNECVTKMGVKGFMYVNCHENSAGKWEGLVPLCDIERCEECNDDYTACVKC